MDAASASLEPERLADAARRMLRAARPAAARPLLAAFERVAPQSPVLAELASGLAAAEGNFPEAIAVLDRGLALAPANAALRKARAGLRSRTGDAQGALHDAAEAVIAAPADAAAKALLGLLLMEAGRLAPARACLAEAVAMEPENPRFRIALAEAATRAGATALARTTLEEAIARAPARPDLRAAAVRAALSAGDPSSAERLAEAARREGAADASVLRLLAQAAASEGRTEAATAALAAAWKLDPADPALRHFAAAAGLLPPPDRAPIEILGSRFRSARVPGLLRAAILTHAAPPSGTQRGPVLDLGCGPGLAAVALSDLPLGPFVGVDVAPAIQALSRSLYAELHDADPIAFLAEDQRSFPLILAADLLNWLGSLDPLFAAIASRLAPHGAFILSLDSIPQPLAAHHEWRLRPDGHYAHTQASLERAARAAGLVPRHVQTEHRQNENSTSDTATIAVLGHAADAR